jgi:hypothetical protein
VDFEGWQYFELIEPESERIQDLAWPYKGAYGIFREFVDYTEVAKLSFWYNLLPNNREVNCLLSPIKALPLIKARLIHPTVEVNGKSIRFPVTVESGCTLEFSSPSDCKLYGPKGEALQAVTPEGEVPWVETGDNSIRYNCEVEPTVRGRANVTIITRGEPLREE